MSIASYLLGRMNVYDSNIERPCGRNRDDPADNHVDGGSDWGDTGDNQPTSKEEVINGLRLLNMAISQYEMNAVRQAIDMLEGDAHEEG